MSSGRLVDQSFIKWTFEDIGLEFIEVTIHLAQNFKLFTLKFA